MAELRVLRLFGNRLEFLLDILPLQELRHLSLANIRIVADDNLRAVSVQIEMENSSYFVASRHKLSAFFSLIFHFSSCHHPLLASALAFVYFLRSTVFFFILALVGVFYPYNRGALFTALVVIYALTSGIAGYTAASFYDQLEGTNWGANAEGVPKRLTYDEIQSQTYTEVKGSGTANQCPTIVGGVDGFAFKAGKYKAQKICLEPTSFTVKAESVNKNALLEFQNTKLQPPHDASQLPENICLLA